MRAKGIVMAALAGGVLLLAPGIEAARADQGWGQRHTHQQAYKGHGTGHGGDRAWGHQRHGGQAYGQRVRQIHGSHLTRHQHRKLRHLRSHFDNERQFRRYLRHQRPRLFARYMAHRQAHRANGFDRLGYRAQRYAWTRYRTN